MIDAANRRRSDPSETARVTCASPGDVECAHCGETIAKGKTMIDTNFGAFCSHRHVDLYIASHEDD